MKSEIVVFLLCVLVVAGIGMSWSGKALQVPDLQPMSVEASPPETSKHESKFTVPDRVKPVATKSDAEVESPAVAPTGAHEPVAVSPVNPLAAKPFPLAGQIADGTSKASVIERFGAPSMFTTATENGHLVETYVYARDGGASTVIRFQDGSVSSR